MLNGSRSLRLLYRIVFLSANPIKHQRCASYPILLSDHWERILITLQHTSYRRYQAASELTGVKVCSLLVAGYRFRYLCLRGAFFCRMTCVSLRIVLNPLLSGIVSDTRGPCASLVVPGIVFDTRVGLERGYSFGWWLPRCIVGIVFYTQGLCVSLVVPGIVFDTREGRGTISH